MALLIIYALVFIAVGVFLGLLLNIYFAIVLGLLILAFLAFLVWSTKKTDYNSSEGGLWMAFLFLFLVLFLIGLLGGSIYNFFSH